MARTEITEQEIALGGLTPSYEAAQTDGNKFLNTGDQFAHIKNGSGGAITVTIQTAGTVEGIAIADPTVSVGAGSEEMIGPFPPGPCNQSDGMVYLDYSAVTSLTIAVLKL